MCQSLFFTKVAESKFLRTPFLTEHLWWLLLELMITFFHFDYHLPSVIETEQSFLCITSGLLTTNDKFPPKSFRFTKAAKIKLCCQKIRSPNSQVKINFGNNIFACVNKYYPKPLKLSITDKHKMSLFLFLNVSMIVIRPLINKTNTSSKYFSDKQYLCQVQCPICL